MCGRGSTFLAIYVSGRYRVFLCYFFSEKISNHFKFNLGRDIWRTSQLKSIILNSKNLLFEINSISVVCLEYLKNNRIDLHSACQFSTSIWLFLEYSCKKYLHINMSERGYIQRSKYRAFRNSKAMRSTIRRR